MPRKLLRSGPDYPDILAEMLLSGTPADAVGQILREVMESLVRDPSCRELAYMAMPLPPEVFRDDAALADRRALLAETRDALEAARLNKPGQRAAIERMAANAELVLGRLREARAIAGRLGEDGKAVVDALARPPFTPTSARKKLEAFDAANPGWASETELPCYAKGLAEILEARIAELEADMAAIEEAGMERARAYERMRSKARALEDAT